MSNGNFQSHSDMWLDIAKERNAATLREIAVIRELRGTRIVETGRIRRRVGQSLRRFGDLVVRIGEQLEHTAPQKHPDQLCCPTCEPDPSWQ